MSTIGIIAEYNPFHNGHRYQLDAVRRRFPEAGVVAVMSGSFTQRGEAALLDKWTRARLAVLGGCNLVLELPAAFVLRSAQGFAQGGVALLSRLGCIERLAFGIEQDNLPTLQAAAQRMDESAFQAALHRDIRQGASYAAALAALLARECGCALDMLKQPNTILALEYLRALKREGSSLLPLAIRRRGADYHDPAFHGSFASASAIRQRSTASSPDWAALSAVLPEPTLAALKSARLQGWAQTEALFPALLARLGCLSAAELAAACGISEGLEHRLLAAGREAASFADFLQQAASKRYPQSRIRRTAVSLLLGLTQPMADAFERTGPCYARVLAFDGRGRKLLRQIKASSSLALITKTGRFLTSIAAARPLDALSPLQRMLLYDCRASDLRALCANPPRPRAEDFTVSPLYVS